MGLESRVWALILYSCVSFCPLHSARPPVHRSVCPLTIFVSTLSSRFWCFSPHFAYVDYPWWVVVYEHVILVVRPVILELWPWPWKYCGICCVQHIVDVISASLDMDYPWVVGVHGHFFFALWPLPWRYDLDLRNHVAAAQSNILMQHWPVLICGLPWGVGMHGHNILPLWLLTLELWPWTWKSWKKWLLVCMDPFPAPL